MLSRLFGTRRPKKAQIAEVVNNPTDQNNNKLDMWWLGFANEVKIYKEFIDDEKAKQELLHKTEKEKLIEKEKSNTTIPCIDVLHDYLGLYRRYIELGKEKDDFYISIMLDIHTELEKLLSSRDRLVDAVDEYKTAMDNIKEKMALEQNRSDGAVLKSSVMHDRIISCNMQVGYADIYERYNKLAHSKYEDYSKIINKVINMFEIPVSQILQHRGGKTFRRRRRRLSKKKRTKSKARKQ